MKATLLRLVLSVTLVSTAVSCTTAYDAYGNPQQVVTPEGALLGAAAVGLLAYGIAESNDRDHRHYRRDRYHRGYSRHHHGYYH